MLAKQPSPERPWRLLTVQEVASLLHVHPNTVRAWSNRGLLRAYRVGPRADRRFHLQDVAALLGERGEALGLSTALLERLEQGDP